MKKIAFLLLILTGVCFADGLVTLIDTDTGERAKKIAFGVPSTAQQNAALALKADATNVTAKTDIAQDLSGDSSNEVPSVAAVNDGLSTMVTITNEITVSQGLITYPDYYLATNRGGALTYFDGNQSVYEYNVAGLTNFSASLVTAGAGSYQYIFIDSGGSVITNGPIGSNVLSLVSAAVPSNADRIRLTGDSISNVSASVNTFEKSWIATDSVKPIPDRVSFVREILPVFNANSNVAFSSVSRVGDFPFDFKWVSGIYAPNGKIYGIPSGITQVLEIDPASGRYSLFGNVTSGSFQWTGGALWRDGNIYAFPRAANTLLRINPNTQEVDEIYLGTSYSSAHHYGGVIYGDTMYCAPRGVSHILAINLNTYETRQLGSDVIGSGEYNSAVLSHYDGKIYFPPYTSSRVMVLDPRDESISFIGSALNAQTYGLVATEKGILYGYSYNAGILKIDPFAGTSAMILTNAYTGGSYGTVQGINGKLYNICGNGTNIYQFVVSSESVSIVGTISDGAYNEAKCAGGILDASGAIWGIPAKGKYIHKYTFGGVTNALPMRVLASPYFSKY